MLNNYQIVDIKMKAQISIIKDDRECVSCIRVHVSAALSVEVPLYKPHPHMLPAGGLQGWTVTVDGRRQNWYGLPTLLRMNIQPLQFMIMILLCIIIILW